MAIPASNHLTLPDNATCTSCFLNLCMQYRQLGNSTLRISATGFGCMSLPADDKSTSIHLLDRAFDVGVNYFDTADLYDHGRNEMLVGTALSKKRKQAVIATKVGNQWKPDGSGWVWNPTKKYILQAADESLKRLRTDYIDLYQLHGGTLEDPIDEVIEAFELLKQQGKIRFYGISSIRPNVIREYVNKGGIVSVMMQYSLADRRPEETVLPLLLKNNIGVLSRGALAQGMLAGKPPKDYLGHKAADIGDAAHIVQSLSSKTRSASRVAIEFILQNPAVTSAVVGCSKLQQLEQILKTEGGNDITASAWIGLQEILPAKIYEQHQ